MSLYTQGIIDTLIFFAVKMFVWELEGSSFIFRVVVFGVL